ncbi:Fic family protein [Candidatus Woesearchaeota archaeon]|nr:Fic family protein [Candidatus Woesearchaeota archaeon]
MFIEKKKIGKNKYIYLRISSRLGNKTKTKTVSYLGKEPLTKKQIDEKISKIPQSKIKEIELEIKRDLKNKEFKINEEFLTIEELKRLDNIQKEFSQKLKKLDDKLIEDMFKDFKTSYIHNTTAIEGNTISLKETSLLINDNLSPQGKDLKEIYDLINERETFNYILEEKPEITLKSILLIHQKLLKDIDLRTGEFRIHNIRILGSEVETTDSKFIYTDLNILLKWYKKNKPLLNPLILAAIFHEKFERIHPFYDGNGRTGRILLNLILIKNSFPPLIIENSKRNSYYEVLTKGHKADLNKTQTEEYKPIVKFCYFQLIETYEKIFAKWG